MNTEQTPFDDHKRWEFEQNRSLAEREHDRQDEAFRRMDDIAISVSHVVLRNLLLINGGAAIALLSFVGKLPPAQAKAVAATLLWFAWGVILTAIAVAFSYFTHFFMAGVIISRTRSYNQPFITDGPQTHRWARWKLIFHILAAATALGSLILFVFGMFAVRAAMLR